MTNLHNAFSLSISAEHNSMVSNNFNQGYYELHKYLVNSGEREPSRYGDTIELLNFKTAVLNPYQRCVGGYNRNINIFFLLAEALWIWAGRRDVKFLQIFNSNMGEFSDDGVHFHAPYGWRLRNYGVDSMTAFNDSNKHSMIGLDQISYAISMLEKNSQDRRVVLGIWNAELDLNKQSKDLPCNDLLMLKVRNGKLHSTIANRSNDLDWGLATNIFQFSFITEIIANTLGVKLGTQTHNSQSLHLYTNNPLTDEIEINRNANIGSPLLYDNADATPMDFNFEETIHPDTTAFEKLKAVDWWVNSMISKLLLVVDGNMEDTELDSFKANLQNFSNYFHMIFCLLEIYIRYKNKQLTRVGAFSDILQFPSDLHKDSDNIVLALNFFAKRMIVQEDVDVVNQAKNIRSSLNHIGGY